MTFNTIFGGNIMLHRKEVLNLVINGWPSILKESLDNIAEMAKF